MKKFYFQQMVLVWSFLAISVSEISAQATTKTPPNAAAVGTWQVVRGSRKLEGTQYMKGNMSVAPTVKWKAQLTGPNGGGEGEPVIGDVNGDGLNDVVMVEGSKLWVFNGSTGALIWNKTGVCNQTSVAIGDVNNDGNMDILSLNDKAYLLNGSTGAVIWSWTPPAAPATGGTIPFSPAAYIGTCPNIGDLDNDGIPEAVILVNDGVYVLNGTNGTQKWKYSTGKPNGVIGFNGSTPAIGDLNNDGFLDVVANVENGQLGGSFGGTGGALVALNGNGGALMWSVPGPTSFGLGSPVPAIGDVDGDCKEDVVINRGAVKGLTGATIWGNPVNGGSEYCIIADLNNDCTVEIITSCGVYAGKTGATIWQVSSCSSNGWFAPAPRVGDFNPASPGKEVVLAGAYNINNPINMFNGTTGALLWAFNMAGQNHTAEGVSIADVDNDGCVEIVVAPDCCNGDPTVMVLDDAPNATGCGILASISQVDFMPGDTTACVGKAIPFRDFSSSCASNWSWSFPGGNPTTSTVKNPGGVTYATPGTYTVTMSAVLNGCNTYTATHKMTIITCGPSVSVNPLTICAGACGNLVATGSGGTGPYTYSWTPGPLTGTTVNVCPVSTSTYTVVVTDNAGATASNTAKVTVNSKPTITLSGGSICPGACKTITAGGGTSYSWSAPLSGSASTQSACPASTTTYTVTGTDANGCTNTATSTVTINPLPTITVTSIIVCKDTVGTITASGGIGYTWTCSGATTASVKPSTAVIGVSTCTVTGTDANGCKNTAVSTITVKDCSTPSVNIIDGTICKGNCYGIKAVGTGGVGTLTYAWNPNIGTGAGPFNECPTATTSYTVTVTDANGVTATDVGTITVNPLPTITASGATICTGACATITASGAGTGSYVWSPSANGSSQSVCPTATSSYTVTGTDANGCTNTATTQVTVNPLPVVSVPDANVCPGGTTTLTATGANTYTWSPSTGLSATTGTSVTYTAGVTTTYTVCGTSTFGCSSCTTVKVTVGALVATTSPNVSICSGTCTPLTAAGGTLFTWSPATGLSATNISNPTACPTVTTTYTVVVSDGTCSDDATVVVTVKPNPTPTISGTLTICNGSSTTLTSTSADSYAWLPGGQTTQSITVSPTNPTNPYAVTVTVNGCTGSASATVTVNPTPAPTISGITTICTGGTTTLTASTAGPYTWSPGGQTTPSITVTPGGTSTYVVSVTQNNCTGTAAQTVTVVPPITVSIKSNNICVGDDITLTGVTNGTSYQWSTGATTNPATVSTPPVGTTTYTLVASTGSCSNTATYAVTVNPLPVPLASGDTTIDYGNSTPLKSSGGGTYQWIPPTGLNCSNCPNPIATPTKTTQYCVIITQQGCSDSACITVKVDLKCGFEGELFVPNGFSPNDDGQNDVLYVRGAGITGMYWAIYDRWGEKVFETTNPKQGWDGTYKGKHLDPAVFIYYLDVTCITGDEIKQKGNVAIVK